MQCGDLYECTYSDIFVDGLAIFGIILWLVMWLVHFIAIVSARTRLFSDAKADYMSNKSKMLRTGKSLSSTDRRGERWLKWSCLGKLFRKRKGKGSGRYIKLSASEVEFVDVEAIRANGTSQQSRIDTNIGVDHEVTATQHRTSFLPTDFSVMQDAELPGVSILKPVCGADSTLKENLESFFLLDYPRFELLFCVHSDTDPGAALIRDLISKYIHVDATLLIGARWVGVNPKINNMQQGYERAKYDLILISDSGLVTQPDTLTQMVYTMIADDRNGVVHQLPFINLGVYSKPVHAELPPPGAKQVQTEERENLNLDGKSNTDWSSTAITSRDASLSKINLLETGKSAAFASSDVELQRFKLASGEEAANNSVQPNSGRKVKSSHKHSMSVDINSSARASAPRFGFPLRPYEAHDDVRDRSMQSDWSELDLQLSESTNVSQQRLASHRASLTTLNARQFSVPPESQPQTLHYATSEIPATSQSTAVASPQIDGRNTQGAADTKSALDSEIVISHLDVALTPSKKEKATDNAAERRFTAFVSALQVVYFGAQHARMYLMANAIGINCVNGMSTLIRKPALDACGGLAAFAGYLAEDYFIAQKLASAGFRTPVCTRVALQNANVAATSLSVTQFEERVQRWYALRISMLPHTILLEPLCECLPVGAIASWSLAHIADYYLLHPLAIFLLHILIWFFLDYLLITIIARSAHVRSPHSARLLECRTDSNDAALTSGTEKASFAYSKAASGDRRLLLFSKSDLLAAWLYRESTSLMLQIRALPRRYIVWRNKVYRVRWGGHTEQI